MKKYIESTINKNRAYLLRINGDAILYTIPKLTPKMKGYFILTYSRLNGKMISLNQTDIVYVAIDFNEFFYLLPIDVLPMRRDGSIKTGFRLDDNSDFLKYIHNYSFLYWAQLQSK